MVPEAVNPLKENHKMNHKLPKLLISNYLIRVTFMLFLGLTIFKLTLLIPLPGKLSDTFRHGYSFWLIAVFVLLFLSSRLPDPIQQPINLIIIIGLFTLPLTALWREGYAEMQIFGGLLSFSDSAQYYHEANRLMTGFSMTSFGARHPFAPALLASILAITGNNLKFTIEIFVFLNALGAFLSTSAIRKTYGSLVGIIYLLLAFLFYRRFVGMTDTENFGFLMGCFAFALLVEGAKHENRSVILFGFLFWSFALNTRPGSFFILPCLLFWVLSTSRIKRLFSTKIYKGLVIAALTFPFFLNLLMANTLATGANGLFSNFSYTLYGITDGGNGWQQIYDDHPEIIAMPIDQTPHYAYKLAFQNLKDDPFATFKGIRTAYADFFSIKDSSIFGFASGGDLTAYNKTNPQNVNIYKMARILLLGLSISGIIWLIINRYSPDNKLLLWGYLGMFLSIPFLPPRDAGIMRVYAASMPFLLVLPGFGLRWFISDPQSKKIKKEVFHLPGSESIFIGFSLIGLTLLGPLTIQQLGNSQETSTISCDEEQNGAIITLRKDSYLYIIADKNLDSTYLPQIRQGDFRLRLQQFPHAEILLDLQKLSPPILIMNAFDLHSGNLLWVIIDPEARDTIDTPILVCGYWMSNVLSQGLGFLYVEDYSPFERKH